MRRPGPHAPAPAPARARRPPSRAGRGRKVCRTGPARSPAPAGSDRAGARATRAVRHPEVEPTRGRAGRRLPGQAGQPACVVAVPSGSSASPRPVRDAENLRHDQALRGRSGRHRASAERAARILPYGALDRCQRAPHAVGRRTEGPGRPGLLPGGVRRDPRQGQGGREPAALPARLRPAGPRLPQPAGRPHRDTGREALVDLLFFPTSGDKTKASSASQRDRDRRGTRPSADTVTTRSGRKHGTGSRGASRPPSAPAPPGLRTRAGGCPIHSDSMCRNRTPCAEGTVDAST